MKFKYKATYDANLDTFRIEYLLGGSAVMALVLPYEYSVVEVGIHTLQEFEYGLIPRYHLGSVVILHLA